MLFRKSLILFLIVSAAILQSTLINYFRVWGAKPDILLILVIFFAFYYGQSYALFVGATCGFFAEVTSGIPLGFAVLTYSLGGLILAHLSRLIDIQRRFRQLCICFIFSLLIELFLFFLLQIFGINPPLFSALAFTILPVSVYTTFAALLLLRFLKIIFHPR